MKATTFIKHSAIYGLGTVVVQASGIILLPIYTKALTPADYGTLEILTRLGEILAIVLLMPGIRQGVLAYYRQSEAPETRQAVVGASLALILAVAILGGFGLSLAAGSVGQLLGIDKPALVRLGVLIAIADCVGRIPLALTQARIEAVRFVSFNCTQLLVKIILSIALVVILKLGIWGVLFASIITSASFALVMVFLEWLKSRPRFDWQLFRSIAHFALPFLPTGICFFLLSFGDRFFLLRYSGQAAVGIYALGNRLATAVGLISRSPLQMVWSAQIYATAKEKDAATVFGQMFTRITAAYLFVGLGVCLLGHEAILFLANPRYLDATKLIAPLVLANLFFTASDLMDASFYVTHKTKYKVGIAMISAGAMVALFFILVPLYQAMGAALATLGGSLAQAGITWKLSQRVFYTRYERNRLLAALGLASAIYAISCFLPSTAWMIPIRISLWLCWPVSLWKTGMVLPEEKAWIQSMANKLKSRYLPVF